jgi:DNA-binding SARP family transcriptional activator
MSSLHLTTLGAVRARTADGIEADWLPGRPRLVALVTYCAMEAPHGWLATDTVTDLFWPEREARRGGRRLSQLFYEAARHAGFRLDQRARGTAMRLVPGVLHCDAAELLHGDVDAAWAAKHVHGELLPGLSFPAGPGFDAWLTAARDRVRARAVSLLLAGAGSAPDRAIEYARLAVRLEPWNEEATTSLMQALGTVGAAPEAWLVYGAYRAYLRDELDLDPPACVTAEVLRVCGSGAAASPTTYEHPATVQATVGAGPALGSAEPDVGGDVVSRAAEGSPPPPRRPWRPRRATAAAALVFAATAAAAVLWATASSADEPQTWAADLAVRAGTGEDAAWRTVIAPELMTKLSRGGMRILHGLADDTRTDGLAPYELAGTFSAGDNEVSGTIRLTDLRTGALLRSWSVAADGDRMNDVAHAISDSIRSAMNSALLLWGYHSSGRAAAAIDALAHAHMEYEAAATAIRQGAATVGEARLALADSLATAASRHDPRWAEPHLLRATVLEHRATRAVAVGNHPAARAHVAAAIAEATRALALNAGTAGRVLRGDLYYLAWITDTPLTADALAAAEADLMVAARSPHASARTWMTLSGLHHAAGRHADAYASALQALRSDVFGTRTDNILMRLFLSAFDGGDDAAARTWCDEIVRRSPGKWHAVRCRLSIHAFQPAVTADQIESIPIDLSREAPALAVAMRARLEALRAVVLASNGFHDQGRSILGDLDLSDPSSELLHYAALVHAQLGELERARELVDLYMRHGGPARATVTQSRWLAALRETSQAR